MADNKEALPVVAWRWPHRSVTTGSEFIATALEGRAHLAKSEGLPVDALTDHATATAAISELRAEVERWKRAQVTQPALYEVLRGSGYLTSNQASELAYTILRLLAARSAASGESAEGGV